MKIMLDTQAKVSHYKGMNRLPLEKRVQILSLLCEGSSMRSISRVADVSINTVAKLLVDAGKACAAFTAIQSLQKTCPVISYDGVSVQDSPPLMHSVFPCFIIRILP